MIADNASPFQGHNIVVLVAKSLYTSLSTLTGMFGVTPVQILMGVGVIVGALLLWTLFKGMTGKKGWTLSESETPDKPAAVDPA